MRDDAAKWITPSLYILTTLMVLWLMNADRVKGIHSSGLLFMFWLFVSLAIVPDAIDCTVRFNQRVSGTLLGDCSQTLVQRDFFLVGFQLFFALASWMTHWFAEKSSLSKMTVNNRVGCNVTTGRHAEIGFSQLVFFP